MIAGRLRWGVVAVLLVAGVLQAFALAWPWGTESHGQAQGLLQLLALAVLAGMVDRSAHVRQAFVQGWWFSTAWLVGSTWWLFISMTVYGGMAAWMAALAVLLLGGGLALFYGAACATYRWLCGGQRALGMRVAVFASVWLLAELVRGTLWTGFPWGAVGYAHVDSVLRHWAPWVGVYGVSAMAAALAMVLGARRGAQISWRERFLAPRAPRVLLRGGVVTVVLAGLAYTWWTAPTRQGLEHDSTRSGLTVRLLQGNVSQDMKFGAGVGQALRDYREALWHNDADLIVTPETAIPMLPEYLPEGYWRTLQQRYASGNQAALVGVPLRSGAGYTNSVLGWAPGAPTYRYDKHHLVPFGEFVPPWFRWFVDRMHIPLGDFSRGAVVQAPLTWKGERIAPNICYEDLFGEELARGFADPRTAPTLLLNLSNIAWFGDTVAIDQHLHISRMRAMELGRPMLRATNTGATAYIDAHGVVVQRLPSSVQGALSVRVQGVDGPPTPYARWVSTQGLWPLAGMAFAVLLLAAMVGRLKRPPSGHFGP